MTGIGATYDITDISELYPSASVNPCLISLVKPIL